MANKLYNYLVHPTQSKSRKISYGEEVHWWRLKTNKDEIKWSNNNNICTIFLHFRQSIFIDYLLF